MKTPKEIGYTAPEVEIVQIFIEKGFTATLDGVNFDPSEVQPMF